MCCLYSNVFLFAKAHSCSSDCERQCHIISRPTIKFCLCYWLWTFGQIMKSPWLHFFSSIKWESISFPKFYGVQTRLEALGDNMPHQNWTSQHGLCAPLHKMHGRQLHACWGNFQGISKTGRRHVGTLHEQYQLSPLLEARAIVRCGFSQESGGKVTPKCRLIRSGQSVGWLIFFHPPPL